MIVKYGASLGFVLGNCKIVIRAEPGHVAMNLICNTPVFFTSMVVQEGNFYEVSKMTK